MWRKKRFIIGLVITVLALSACLGGVALAQGNDEDNASESIYARVAEKLGIDRQVLEDAFAEAREEMQEEALDGYLQRLVDEGIITQEQAAEYKEWRQSRPDMSGYMDALRDWFESKPDVPGMFEFRSFGGSRGMGGMRGFGGLCLPTQ
jgi:hypothetical protein